MPKRCCVCRVEKTREATSEGIRFFLFPSTKSALYGEWIRAIKNEGKKPHLKPKRSSTICSQHFTDDSYVVRRDARVCLKDTAKPTIFNFATDEAIPVESEKIPTNVAQPETNGSNIKDDDVSDSLSPPDLLPAVSEYNSDFEENVEDPPDLDIFSYAQGIDNGTLNPLADPNTISVDHIGSVADILGPDAYLSADTVEEEMMNQDRPESGGTEELDIVDGQPIVSFLSVEEMEEYSARHGSSSLSGISISKTNESSGSRSLQGKCQPGSGQPTPTLSPSPSPFQMLEGGNAPVFSDDSCPSTTPAPSVDMDNEKKGVSIIIAEPSPSATDEDESPSSTPAPEMDTEGYITPQFAEYAVSAVSISQRGRYRARSAKKAEEEAPPLPSKKKALSVPSQSNTVQPPNQEVDNEEVSDVNLVMTGDDSLEEVPVVEEEYLEVYDVPGKSNVSAGSCGKLFCQMGCVCPSLEAAKNRKSSTEHCSRPDCMLQCVCGYLPGKPSSRRSFFSLLKGNESFYSKINWSSERSKRERKVPERYSEYHLDKDSMSSPEENSARSGKQKNANNRSVSPFKLSNKVAIQLQQQQVIKKKPEPLRIKIGADEIKLLRWDSFVSMKKIYVAPDQEVYCIEHSNYSCPCIAENRRIIRILNKFIPPNVQVNQSNGKKDSVVSPPNKNVARKHTHPIMRTAHLKGASPINGSASPEAQSPTPVTSSAPSTSSASSKTPGQVPVNKPGGDGMSKMRKLLQDERFQLQKLMNDEKMRAFDDEVDLVIRSGQTVQLVAWIRFHSVYHSGKMHIRYLSRRSGPVILVMKPTDIVAADITCDIQDMKDKPNIPEIVKELLDACISPEETSRYAFLLCDGVKWELVGCLSLKASTVLPTPAPTQSKPALPAPSSSGAKKKPKNTVTKAMPEVILEEQELPEEYQEEPSIPEAIPEKSPSPAAPNASKYEDHSTEERLKAMELKRKKLEERLNQINSKLCSAPVKVSFPARSMKPKMQKHSSTAKDPLLSSSPSVREPLPTSNTSTPSRSTDCSFDQCILPDDMPKHSEYSQSNGLSQSLYPAAETLAMFTRQVMSSVDAFVGLKTASVSPMSVPKPKPFAPPTVLFPSPTSLSVRPDVQLMKTPPIGVGSVSSTVTPTGPNRPRLIPPLQRMPNTASTSSQKSPPTAISDQRSSLADLIRLQRLNWTNKGVIPPVVAKNISAVGPSSITPSMSVTAVPASTSTAPAPKVISITNTSAASILKTAAVTLVSGNQVGASSSSAVCKPSVTVTPEKLQTTINTSTSSEKAEVITVSSVPTRNKAQETDDATKKKEEEDNKSFFPKVLSTHVGPVRLAKPTEEGRTLSSRLKISFAALTGENRNLSPAPSTMLLPLYNPNDEWCMVACPAVPEAGLQIPGVNVLIPRNVVERAATTAVERKARVSFPLHFHGKVSSPILKKGFGVYGTPQLPHHVFLGPFPTEHLDSFATIPTCMVRISSKTGGDPQPEPLTPVIVSVTSTKESSDSQSTEEKPIEEKPVDESSEIVPAATDKEKDVEEPKPADDSPVLEAPESSTSQEDPSIAPSDDIADKDDQVPVTPLDDPADLNEPVPEIPEKGVPESAEDTPESAGEDNVSNPSSESQQDSGVDDKSSYESAQKSASAGEESDVEIVDECKRNPPLLKPPVAPAPRAPLPKELSLPNLPKDFGSHKSTKPQRVFVARTQGLPTTTIAIFEENLVLVKHPLKPDKSVSFTDVDAAKRWLQSLTVLNNKEQGARSTERKRSAPADESSSTSTRHAERDRRSHEYDGESIYYQKRLERSDISDPSSSASSPKRVRRLTEKARILAAQSSRHNEVSPEPERPTSTRGPRSKSVPGKSPKARSELVQTPNQHSSFNKTNRNSHNRQLHIVKEQERRELLGKLLRDLDSLIAPNSGSRAKIVVLKNATSTVKSLEEQDKALSVQYETLKNRRVALLKMRQKMFNELPNEVRQIFQCLMDTVPVPARHVALAEARSRQRSRKNESVDFESSSNSAFNDPDDIDVTSFDADGYDSELSMQVS